MKKIIKKNFYFAIAIVALLFGITFVVAAWDSSKASHTTLYTNRIEPKTGNTIVVSNSAFFGVYSGQVILPGGTASFGKWPTYFNSSNGNNYIRGTTILADNGGFVGIGAGASASGTNTLVVYGSAWKSDGNTLWSVGSDVRLKDVKGNYEYGLGEISKINPIRFNYKKDNELGLPSDEEKVGVSAQEVEKIIPEAVIPDEKGYLSLRPDPIFWAMLNSIKELKSQNDELKAELCKKDPSYSWC